MTVGEDDCTKASVAFLARCLQKREVNKILDRGVHDGKASREHLLYREAVALLLKAMYSEESGHGKGEEGPRDAIDTMRRSIARQARSGVFAQDWLKTAKWEV